MECILPVCLIVQGVSAITRYQDSFFADFDFASQGGNLRYRDTRKTNPQSRSRSSRESATKRKIAAAKSLLSNHNRFLPDKPVVNEKYSNDGRAPDTTKKLFSQKSGRLGRPPGSRNRIRAITSVGDIDWTNIRHGLAEDGAEPRTFYLHKRLFSSDNIHGLGVARNVWWSNHESNLKCKLVRTALWSKRMLRRCPQRQRLMATAETRKLNNQRIFQVQREGQRLYPNGACNWKN